MKYSYTLLGLAALSGEVMGSSMPAVKSGSLAEIYEELSECLSPMGYCFDLTPRVADPDSDEYWDSKVEGNYKTKAQCQDHSFHAWQSFYPTAADFEAALKERDTAADTGTDLFLMRRTSGLPVTKGLADALTESIPGSSYEGYLRCGSREYIYVYGDKQGVYNSVGDSFEKIGFWELKGFDAALPVPTNLRLSPYALVPFAEDVDDDDDATCTDQATIRGLDEKFLSAPNTVACNKEIKLKVILAGGEKRTITQNKDSARRLQDSLNHHGRHLLEGKSVTVEAHSTSRLMVSGLSHDHARKLLATPEDLGFQGLDQDVVWVERQEKFKFANYDAGVVLQGGATRDSGKGYERGDPQLTPFWSRGITGKGQVVGMADSGLATEHCYFQDPDVDTSAPRAPKSNVKFEGHRKLTNYLSYVDGLPSPGDDHGTHVAGTIVGQLSSESEVVDPLVVGNEGVAYEAKLSVFDIGGPNGLDIPADITNDFMKPMYDEGVRIQTNSWGVSYGNYMSDTARGFDEFMFKNQDVIVLVAAGNSEYHKGSQGSMGSPATAKNVVSVGASMNTDAAFADIGVWANITYSCDRQSNSAPCESGLAYFSSNGPAFDGRIKPDVVAPGFFVMSAAASTAAGGDAECGVAPKAGTSMATPATAGALALARQYFTDGFYPSGEANAADSMVPMGALLKAVAVNSAVPLTGDYSRGGPGGEFATSQAPNHEYGFGLVQLDNTLILKGHNDASRTVYMDGDFDNMPAVENWEAKSYFFDAGSNPVALKATLVWADAPAFGNARTALVNDLDLEVRDSEGNILNYPNNRNYRDIENNVEQTLTIVQGKFEVRVVGRVVPVGPQPFALIVNGESFEFLESYSEAISFNETANDYSFWYYLAFLAGGVAIGGAGFLGAMKVSKKRNPGVDSGLESFRV